MDKESYLERIRKAREKTAPLEEEISKQAELKELERKAILVENWARDLPEVQAAEEKYGEIKYENTRLGAIVVKKPHHINYQKFMNKLSISGDNGVKEKDYWGLVRHCLVYPDRVKAEEIIEEYPGVLIKLANKIAELANGEAEEVEGK